MTIVTRRLYYCDITVTRSAVSLSELTDRTTLSRIITGDVTSLRCVELFECFVHLFLQ